VAKIKMLCAEEKITIAELERKTGISNGQIRKWVAATPGIDKLQTIADHFKVSTDYLLGRTAFRKPTELFERWGASSNPDFESPFDFGGLLKKAREEQGVKQKEASEALGITESDVDDIEVGDIPLNEEWAEKYANFLGTTVDEIYVDNDMSAALDSIPPERLHHYQSLRMSEIEMVEADREFEKTNAEDAMKDYEDDDTIAAHHDGEVWTEEELAEIERFKEFVRDKRGKK